MTPSIDEDLYSRQLGAYGMETMGKLIKMRVLVIGVNGTGAEVCKNLCLAGPQSIAICDDSVITTSDLCANFFLKPSDVGMIKSESILPRLNELNDYVHTHIISPSSLSPEFIASNFDCVVICGKSQTDNIKVNQMCRDAAKIKNTSIPFISANASGLTSSVFSDFGDSHTVIDMDGENEKNGIVQGIVQDGDTLLVSLIEDRRSPFSNGEFVTFEEVEGMNALNGAGPFEVSINGKYGIKLSIPALELPAYTGGGIIKQVKVAEVVKFEPLHSALDDPIPDGMFNTPDFSAFDRPVQLHLAFRGLEQFRLANGRLPELNCQKDALEVLEITKKIHMELKNRGLGWLPEEIEDIVPQFVALLAKTEISPLASFAGGIAAQEVVKATGKFMPIKQFFHLDYFNLLKELPTTPVTANDRYRDMRAIFGDETFNQFQSAKIFLVGAGALGCEFLKLFSLMGIASSQGGGKLTVTDMDTIENSNLNRQFLFRKRHIGKLKSEVAAESAHDMNPDFRVAPTQTRVGKESEDYFDDKFWSGLDVVVNALDNVESRLYVDSRCVWYNKPLLESGTLGTKCNSQVVVPLITECYGDSQDPPEESIPLCTLKNFPYLIDHCLQWSRDTFQGIFTDIPEDLGLAIKDFKEFERKLRSEGFPKMQVTRVESILNLLQLAKHPSVESAVQISVQLFMNLHNYPMNQLLFNFPPDHITSEGVKFWSGTKRLPTALDLKEVDPMIGEFISATSKIYGNIVNFKSLESLGSEELVQVAKTVKVREFEPDYSAKIQVEENEEGTANNDDTAGMEFDEKLTHLLEKLRNEITNDLVVEPEVFEKDLDANHHIDFVHACGNLRARNYSIKECARHESKMIAGKIIPALATTTAMITGIVSLEMLKTFDKTRPIEDYRNSFMNIAIPVWILSEPMPAKKNVDSDYNPVIGGAVIARPSGFTIWDKVEVDEPGCTVRQLIEHIESKFDVDCSVLSCGSKMLYMGYIAAHKARLDMPITKAIEMVTGIPVGEKCKFLSLETACTDKESGDDVVIPQIRIKIA